MTADPAHPIAVAPFHIGDRVRTSHGVGTVEFTAYSNAMQSPVYTVALNSRIKLRLLARDLVQENRE